MQKTVLVDHSQAMRDDLKLLLDKLSARFQLTAEASSVQELFPILATDQVSMVLLGPGVPATDALEATRYIKEHYPQVKVVFIFATVRQHQIAQLVEAGADGFISQSPDPEELLQALEIIATGTKYLAAPISLKLLAEGPVALLQGAGTATLTSRELEILRYIKAIRRRPMPIRFSPVQER